MGSETYSEGPFETPVSKERLNCRCSICMTKQAKPMFYNYSASITNALPGSSLRKSLPVQGKYLA